MKTLDKNTYYYKENHLHTLELRVNKKRVYLVEKRLFDLISSIIGLILLSPLFLLIILAIELEEPFSPIFFSQERLGKDGNIFRMYKFRSMCIDAEKKLDSLIDKNELSGAMFKMKNDPRVTRIGRLIRKTSLDELPQLVNVIKGEMSLVGPRPPLIREVIKYSEHDLKRLLVKPGCSGLWQVSGRNDLSFAQMVELDLKYIANQSFWGDIKIIFLTFKIIVFPNSAY